MEYGSERSRAMTARSGHNAKAAVKLAGIALGTADGEEGGGTMAAGECAVCTVTVK